MGVTQAGKSAFKSTSLVFSILHYLNTTNVLDIL